MSDRRIAALVLAAGEARRFGGPKQLALLDGRPLLEHVCRAVASAPAIERAVVTVGAHADAVLAGVDMHGAEPLRVPDWREGQAASLRAGVTRLADADAVVVVLGDQPELSAAAIERVVAAWDGLRPAVRASFGGAPGHPVLLARSLFADVAALRGDVGARALFAHAPPLDVACGAAAVRDVDTPAALARLRAARR